MMLLGMWKLPSGMFWRIMENCSNCEMMSNRLLKIMTT